MKKLLLLLLTAIFLMSCSKDDICECKQYFSEEEDGIDMYGDCRVENWLDENLNDGIFDHPDQLNEFFIILELYECNK